MSQAIKDFVRGMGQALDLGATMSPPQNVKRKTDAQAIGEHWNRVGNYVRGACHSAEKESRGDSPVNY